MRAVARGELHSVIETAEGLQSCLPHVKYFGDHCGFKPATTRIEVALGNLQAAIDLLRREAQALDIDPLGQSQHLG